MSKGKYKRKRERVRQKAKQQIDEVRFPRNELIPTKNQPEHSATRGDNRSEKKETAMRFREAVKRSSFTDWVIMVFTGVLAAVGIYQYFAMGESNKINRQSLVAVQRAFIGSPTISDQRKITDGKRVAGIQFRLNWQNSGNTAAKDLRICTSREDNPAGNMKNLPDKCQPVPEVAGPRDVVQSLPIVFEPPLLELLRDGKTKVTLWGWVKYRDSFPDTPEHITRYCSEFGQVIGGTIPDPKEPFELQVSGCTNSYSCSDEGCATTQK